MVADGVVIKRVLMLVTTMFGLMSVGLIQVRTVRQSDDLQTPSDLAFVAPTPETAMTFIAPTPRPTQALPDNLAPYPIYGPGVELRNDVWLNTDHPQHLTDLRGRVVLLSFWAFDCIPCLPTLASVRGWYDEYTDHGLTVIGVHYPKVDAERSYDGLVAALERLDIHYPVIQDNDGLTWNAYGQNVWPTLTLLDKRGYLRYRQVGAGGDAEMETAIQALLAEDA